MLSNAFKLFQAPSSGKDAISIVLTTEHYAVTCDKTGVPKSGELGAVLNGFIDPSATGRCYTKVSVYRGSTMLVKGLDWEWGADWDYSLHIGWAYSKPVAPPDIGAFGDTVYITQLNADSGYLGLKINVGGSIYTKYFRFNKLKDGQTGADSYSVVLTNETQVVACNSDGSLKAGELDRAVTDIQVYKGNTQLAWNVDWVIDETIFSGAYFSADNSTIKLSYFENGSISGACEIGIMIGTIYIYKTFSVTKSIDTPVPFTTKEPWSTSSVFQNGQYLRYEGKVYIWSYPYPGNSILNPKDDIINNPITTHWKGYEIWELVATDLLLSRLIRAEEIDVNTLVVKTLKTANSGPRIEIFGSMLYVYGNFANPNIILGVNNRGMSVVSYYDNNGNKIYDMGPNGFDWGSIVPASWSSTRLTKICNVLASDAIPSWGNITSQSLTSIKNVSASTGSDYYQYYAGSNPALTDADRIPEQYLFVYQYVNSGKIEDGWYARSTNGHLQYMSDNTQNWIKPEPAAIYEYTVGVRDQDPIYMDTIVEYIGGIPVREINIFWNELIIEY